MSAKLTYRLDYSDDMPDGDRGYEVLRFGHVIGYIEKDWVPSDVEGSPVRGWAFSHRDGRKGEGRTRPAAIAEALAKGPAQS